jgi:UDP-2-acetamido-2,6-beta-L-arabino-hexul-4-ose reductase
MRIVITGANGFIGQNLRVKLAELGYTDTIDLVRGTPMEEFHRALAGADFVFHLAGVNRPQDPAEFSIGNASLTQDLCESLERAGKSIPIVFASSVQAGLNNLYGQSKLAAEAALTRYGLATGAPVYLLRLNNVFGKWCRPNYNSVVATFCHNISRGLPIVVHNPDAVLKLVYVDDVLHAFIELLSTPATGGGFIEVGPVYEATVGGVADTLRGFEKSRESLISPRVGVGLVRALYSTYISSLSPEAFSYTVNRHEDARGEFVEVLKTPDCGQFSYFTACSGATRGDHYHHSKTEKFLVVRGTALFRFRHITTGEAHEFCVCGGEARIVETIPGWVHNITNTGHDDLIVMLWANEIFDPQNPDTVARKVSP